MRLDRRFPWWAALVVLLLPLPAGALTVSPGGSIQAAINQIVGGAVPDTVIDVQPGTYNEALIIRNTNRSFTLRSTGGAGATTINGTGSGRSTLLIINATGALAIDGFTVTGGVGGPGADTGGGFTIQDSSPTISNCVFAGNTSSLHGGGGTLFRAAPQFQSVNIQNNQAAVFGGGVFVWIGSNPTFANSVITGNSSGTGAFNGAGGGAALIDAAGATFRTTTISNNVSRFAGGGVFALHTFTAPGPTTSLVLDGADVVGNTTMRSDNSQPPAMGGGIHIEDNVNAQVIRTKIRNNTANDGGGLSTFRARYDVTASFIEMNTAPDPLAAGGLGGGILGSSSGTAAVVVVSDSVIRNNSARQGGGVAIDGDPATGSQATLSLIGSVLEGNTATALFGGGIYAGRTVVGLVGTMVLRNTVPTDSNQSRGGGLMLLVSNTTLTDATIAGNSARLQGGGIYVDVGGSLNIDQSRIHKNSVTGSSFGTARGGGLFVGSNPVPTGTVQNSDFADNTGFEIGENACPTIPPFTPSPILMYFNNRITAASGSNVYQSPCNPPGTLTAGGLNTVNPARASGNTSPVPTFAAFAATPDTAAPAGMVAWTGATNVLSWTVARATSISIAPTVGMVNAFNVPTGTADVTPSCTTSYTLTPTGNTMVAGTSVSAPTSLVEFGPSTFAYNIAFTGGVFVGAGDVDNDTRAEVITGAGAGGGPHVRVFKIDNAGNFNPFAEFFPYVASFTGGVFVAAGDVTGDGRAEVVTGAGAGGGPHVRLFQVSNGGVVSAFSDIVAYDPAFTGGVRVAVGNVDVAAAAAEVITAAGPGGGPHVKVFKISPSGVPTLFAQFFAYNVGFTGGVFVAAGDIDGDGVDEIITAAGAGGGPHVRVWKVSPGGSVSLFAEFFAYDVGFLGGVFVAAGNLATQGGGEIVTGVGFGGGPDLRVYNVFTGMIAQAIVYPPAFIGGVRVAVGNVDGMSPIEIITGAGPGGGPHVRLFRVPVCP